MMDGTSTGRAAPVAIVGAGPVGLSLALGLARQGVRSVLLEKKPATSERSKAPAIHVRTREVFRLWGLEQRLVAAGVLRRSLTVHSASRGSRPLLSLDFAELEAEADRPGLLVLEQGETERGLLEAVRETGHCQVRFGAEAVALAQERDHARLTVREARTVHLLEAGFVVGCDGASSFVRGALGLPFDGITYGVRPMLADVRVDDERDRLPWPRLHNARGGLTSAIRLRSGHWRIIRLESGAGREADVPRAEVLERVREVLGEGEVELVWASRFRIHLRSAPRFRAGRVLLAGDAAHIHSPAGGLGMNAGIHDASNLAWKLAAALRGGDVERLLDSYDVERRALSVEHVSRYADLLTRAFLETPAPVRGAVIRLLRGSLAIPPLRRRFLRRTTMIDLDYPASPLLDPRETAAGVRLPNPLLLSPDGKSLRLYDVLEGRPVILELTERRNVRIEPPLEEVIRIGAGGYHEPHGLLRRLLGGNDGWILVRPDGHVGWARDRPEGMAQAARMALGAAPASFGRRPRPRRPGRSRERAR